MIRAVLDPGVLISAILSRSGPPAQLLRAWLDGRIDVITSPLLVDELDEVLEREKFRRWLTLDDASAYVDLIRFHSSTYEDPPAQTGRTRDSDDDYLVSLAEATRAHVLVSGDSDLSDRVVTRIRIMTPRELLDLIDQ